MGIQFQINDALGALRAKIGRMERNRSQAIQMLEFCRRSEFTTMVGENHEAQHERARSVVKAVHQALVYAIDQPKNDPTKAFKDAEECLCGYYSKYRSPDSPEDIAEDIRKKMENARNKDKGRLARLHDLMARRGEKYSASAKQHEAKHDVKVNTYIGHKSLTGGQIMVPYTFSGDHSLSMVMWMLLHRKHVDWNKNPFLYEGLPHGYDSGFIKEPVQLSQRLTEFKLETLSLMVLVDRGNQIRINHPQLRRTFGNIWKVEPLTIILKDVNGKLEAAERVGGSSQLEPAGTTWNKLFEKALPDEGTDYDIKESELSSKPNLLSNSGQAETFYPTLNDSSSTVTAGDPNAVKNSIPAYNQLVNTPKQPASGSPEPRLIPTSKQLANTPKQPASVPPEPRSIPTSKQPANTPKQPASGPPKPRSIPAFTQPANTPKQPASRPPEPRSISISKQPTNTSKRPPPDPPPKWWRSYIRPIQNVLGWS